MKFTAFKELRVFATTTVQDIIKYLSVDLAIALRELSVGLKKLDFLENYESFKVSVSIPATSELAIRNELRDGTIPRFRIVVKGGANAQHIVDGTTAWTSDFVYLYNTSASTATADVVFFK